MTYYQLNEKWICKECNRDFGSRQATTSHIFRAHTNGGKAVGGRQKGTLYKGGYPAWNKGLTKETDSRVAKNALAVSIATKGRPGRPHTDKTKRLISRQKSINNKGGRSKWYEVAGQKVQGTWERNVASKFEELGITWEKLKTNQHTFDYVMNGKVRCYTPDFYLKDFGIYIEIKGRWWGNDREKMNIVLKTYPDKRIVIVEKEGYEKILRGELVW